MELIITLELSRHTFRCSEEFDSSVQAEYSIDAAPTEVKEALFLTTGGPLIILH
jgi:hypothetical protein